MWQSAERSLTESSTKPVEVVSILGGGWSALFVDRDNLPGTVIGVNDSFIRAKCHAGVSMDRLWTEWRWPDMMNIARKAFIRDAALKNITDRPAWLRPFECNYKTTTFGGIPEHLNGTNSGLCAMNVAYLLRPRRLYLFGFDMNRSPNGNPYWFPAYPWAPGGATKNGKYDAWAREMEHVAEQFRLIGVEVLNVSVTSSISAFRKITPADLQREMS